MDYLLEIRNIISKMEKYGYAGSARKIKEIRDSAPVGSELIMSVTHELLQMVSISRELKRLIGTDVVILRDYCWSIGLMVK
jgi:hypothetical protein